MHLWKVQREIVDALAPETSAHKIVLMILGRRSGKTTISAAMAVYLGVIYADEYKKHLRDGEPFYIVCGANSQDQARILLNAIKDFINDSDILRHLVEGETADTLTLSNGCIFKALSSSGRSARGLACPVVILDEFAHFTDTEGNASGSNILQALTPATAQFGELGKILILSTPWLKRGSFYELFEQSKTNPRIKVYRYTTRQVNPTISDAELQFERDRDPTAYAVEFEAQFAEDSSSFLDPELIEESINYRRSLLPPKSPSIYYKKNPFYEKEMEDLRNEGYSEHQIMQNFRPLVWMECMDMSRYVLSLDPSLGGRDDYTAVIAHLEKKGFGNSRQETADSKDVLVVDVFHKFEPTIKAAGNKTRIAIDEVHRWIMTQHKNYRFKSVGLDQYGSQYTIQYLKNKVPEVIELIWSRPSKKAAYSTLRDLIHTGRLELYPHDQAISQLKNLMIIRSTDDWTVSGGVGAGVDDYASALAGAVWMTDIKTPGGYKPQQVRWVT